MRGEFIDLDGAVSSGFIELVCGSFVDLVGEVNLLRGNKGGITGRSGRFQLWSG